MHMKKVLMRVLTGIVLSAVISGATAAYQVSAQPIDGTQIATLDDLKAALPRDTRYYQETMRLNQIVLREMTGGALPGDDGKDWSESVSYEAYDPEGRRIALLATADGSVILGLYDYDQVSNCVRGRSYRNQEMSFDTVSTYDEQGRVIERTILIQGESNEKTTTVYEPLPDGTTRAVATTYDADGSVMEEDTHILDSQNRVIHSEIPLGVGMTIADYTYDDQDRLIHSLVDYGDGRTSENTFQYTDSANGTTGSYAYYQNGVLQSRFEQRFDALGVCVYQAEYTAEGVLTSETIREPIE